MRVTKDLKNAIKNNTNVYLYFNSEKATAPNQTKMKLTFYNDTFNKKVSNITTIYIDKEGFLGSFNCTEFDEVRTELDDRYLKDIFSTLKIDDFFYFQLNCCMNSSDLLYKNNLIHLTVKLIVERKNNNYQEFLVKSSILSHDNYSIKFKNGYDVYRYHRNRKTLEIV